MRETLGPAMNHNGEVRDAHGGAGDGYAEAAWMTAKGIDMVIQAAQCARDGEAGEASQRLADADSSARRAAKQARHVRATGATPAELAAQDAEAVDARLMLGDVQASRVTAAVHAYDEDTDTDVEEDLVVTVADEHNRPNVAWSGRSGPLALDGRTHLDLLAAADEFASAYDRYLIDTAAQSACDATERGWIPRVTWR